MSRPMASGINPVNRPNPKFLGQVKGQYNLDAKTWETHRRGGPGGAMTWRRSVRVVMETQ